MTDSESVTRLFQTKKMPPPLWNACDFVLQFKFTIAHIPVKLNTAVDFSPRLEPDPIEKIFLKIIEDSFTLPTEVNIESIGKAQKYQVSFQTDDVELPSKEWLWQHKQDKRNAVLTDFPVIILSHLHKNDTGTNTIMHNIKLFNKVPRILIEQDADLVLLILKRQMLGKLLDEQIVTTNSGYTHFAETEKASNSKMTSCTDNITTTSLVLAI